MIGTVGLNISCDQLTGFCDRYQVRELALFGSMVGENPVVARDVDLLVSFKPTARVTFLTLAKMQRELEGIIGRKVDLVLREGLKPTIRDQVLASAQVLYAA
jgi:predicted nucleotidyltransferase